MGSALIAVNQPNNRSFSFLTSNSPETLAKLLRRPTPEVLEEVDMVREALRWIDIEQNPQDYLIGYEVSRPTVTLGIDICVGNVDRVADNFLQRLAIGHSVSNEYLRDFREEQTASGLPGYLRN